MNSTVRLAPMDDLKEGLLFDPREGFFNGKSGKPQTFQIGNWSNPIEYYVAGGYNIDDGAGFSWEVQVEDGIRFLRYPLEIRRAAATLAYGNTGWRNYSASIRLIPETGMDYSGLAFRYVNSRCYYALLLGRDSRLRLVRREHEEWTVLEESVELGGAKREYELRVTVLDDEIVCELDGKEVYRVRDGKYPEGAVALVTYSPASFSRLELELNPEELEQLKAREARSLLEIRMKRDKMVQPVLYNKIVLPAGIGGNFRIADGNREKRLVFVQAEHLSPLPNAGNVYERITCITVMNLGGEILWQRGNPSAGTIGSSCFQICDIDGDGNKEMLVTMNFEILLLDFETGAVKNSCPTPLAPKMAVPFTDGPEDYYPRILGDNIFVFDRSGGGRPDAFLIKDRYNNVWCYDNRLRMQWQMAFITGHYPTVGDVDGDGLAEILLGNRCIAGDGKILWMLPLGDHVDNIAMGRFEPAPAEDKIYYAAGEEGFVVADTRGRILKQLKIGHVQGFCTAPFAKELEGQQFLVRTLWGDQGLVYAMDCRGHILKTVQLGHRVNLRAVNWTGDGTASVLLQDNRRRQPVFMNFELEEVGEFGDLSSDANYGITLADLTGDSREEIVLMGGGELSFYTQDRRPATGEIVPLRRLMNEINHSGYQPDVLIPLT